MADVDALIEALTLGEKAGLTAGEDLWSTVAVARVGIPKIVVTDGPSGARGPGVPGVTLQTSSCIPCGTALGATWDPELVEALGALIGREARARGCRVLLAPTVNLHRSPLAGRSFECYSEDPLLTGRLAARFVRGVQAQGVIATAKHLVGNETEHERLTSNSVIDPRTLRELYLLPFELAVRDGGALALMTAYNRLNGAWVTEQAEILRDIVRGEWGFDGLVMTDWFGVADTETSIAAGLDLEMPGPGRAYGPALAEGVVAGTVDEADVDAAVRRLLTTFDRVGALDGAFDGGALDGGALDGGALDGGAVPDRGRAAHAADGERVGPRVTAGDIALLRRAAADAAVLLTNDGTLPLRPAPGQRVAVVGPGAATANIMGGGSAEVTPPPLTTPLEALRAALTPDVEVVHERGCDIDRSPRPVGSVGLRAPDGFTVGLHAGGDAVGEAVDTSRIPALRVFHFGAPHPALAEGEWSMRIRGEVVADESGTHTLALAQSGAARVLVDGRVVLDGVESPPPPGGTEFFGLGSQDLLAEVVFEAGVPAVVEVELASRDAFVPGVRVGFRPPTPPDLLARAVTAAGAADVAIVIVGTNREWETEGHDRESMRLPGDQDELVRLVAATGRPTVVVVNAASPMEMPWCDDVAAVLQCWFGGQEMAGALADVLTGAAEPGGRLPTTIPERLEHNPAHDNFPGENGEVRYGEGVFMGYRGYEHRAITPRFAFGHGLGYTTFELGPPVVSADSFTPGASLTVSVPVTNTGARPGSTVVQCYVAPESPRLARPPKELKAFAKVRCDPGETRIVDLVLDERAFAYWDPGQPDWHAIEPRGVGHGIGPAPAERREPGWQVDPGRYDILVGRSSSDLTGRAAVRIDAGP